MPRFVVSTEPVNCAALSAGMQNDAAGAFVSFEGWVRNNNEGHSVNGLEYEVFHELVVSEGQKILAEAIAQYGLLDAEAVHREGTLAIGDCAVWIGVTARHRGEAFAACRYIIDELKHRLPVWKKEHYQALEPQWVNCQHQPHHTPPVSINANEFYARQMILPEVGEQGQARMANARILIVGVGGLGTAAAIALAGAGVGTIGLADHDILSVTNLHRQLIYSAADIGKPKVHLAATRLKALNPLITLSVHNEKVTSDNIEAFFSQYDIVLDCTDNFTAKYLLNDAAILYDKPVIQASIYRFEGQILTIDPTNEAGCLRCLFPEIPAPGMVGDCATVGVLGTVPMLFGALQANEAIKRILNIKSSSDLHIIDLLSLHMQSVQRYRSPDCALCGEHKTIDALSDDSELVIDDKDTIKNLHQHYTFIDVREKSELLARPLSDALHVPTSVFDVCALSNIDKEQPLLVICAKGGRSLTATQYLRKAGWKKAYSLAGGLDALLRDKECT